MSGPKNPSACLASRGEGYFLCARDLTVGPWGSRFTLEHGAERVEATCYLLGRHNVMNLLGAASVALELGMDLAAIARGIGKIAPIEHRLQLLPSGNGVTVIDDAFNANPAGFAAAMEVLRGFPGRKIVLTPGLVELGEARAGREPQGRPALRRELRHRHPGGQKAQRPWSRAQGRELAGQLIWRRTSPRPPRPWASSPGWATWCCLKTTFRTTWKAEAIGGKSHVEFGGFLRGRSCEHDVSIVTGLQAMEYADPKAYRLIPIYIARDGAWYTGAPAGAELLPAFRPVGQGRFPGVPVS